MGDYTQNNYCAAGNCGQSGYSCSSYSRASPQRNLGYTPMKHEPVNYNNNKENIYTRI